MADPVLAKVLESGRGPGDRHSLLYRWMWRHHTALARQFAEAQPSWTAMAQTFAEEGLVDRTGKPPTPKTAQQTWRRVRAAKARAAAQKLRQRPKDALGSRLN